MNILEKLALKFEKRKQKKILEKNLTRKISKLERALKLCLADRDEYKKKFNDLQDKVNLDAEELFSAQDQMDSLVAVYYDRSLSLETKYEIISRTLSTYAENT